MSTTGFRGFDHTIQETNIWLHEISEAMGHPSRQVAYHALRGVLFALRDRLIVDEALNLAAQLPMLVRGLYFEGYKAAGKPELYHKDEFLARVAQELTDHINPETATRAVFAVLERHITAGEIEDVRNSLPADLRRLWQPSPETAHVN